MAAMSFLSLTLSTLATSEQLYFQFPSFPMYHLWSTTRLSAGNDLKIGFHQLLKTRCDFWRFRLIAVMSILLWLLRTLDAVLVVLMALRITYGCFRNNKPSSYHYRMCRFVVQCNYIVQFQFGCAIIQFSLSFI